MGFSFKIDLGFSLLTVCCDSLVVVVAEVGREIRVASTGIMTLVLHQDGAAKEYELSCSVFIVLQVFCITSNSVQPTNL